VQNIALNPHNSGAFAPFIVCPAYMPGSRQLCNRGNPKTGGVIFVYDYFNSPAANPFGGFIIKIKESFMSSYFKRVKVKLIIQRYIKLSAEYEPYSYNNIEYYKLNAKHPEMCDLMDSLEDALNNVLPFGTDMLSKKASEFLEMKNANPKYHNSLGTKKVAIPFKTTLRRFQFGFVNKELTDEQLDAIIEIERLLSKAEAAFPKYKNTVVMERKIEKKMTER
jgi:DNA replicative helicase MCM subunit Mcm2 (Cdc46/Mcm family)